MDEITQAKGASHYFLGGVTVYQNRIKRLELNIPGDLLRQKGAVSSEVAKALAANVRAKMNSDFGIGITGIAGPTGGSKAKPVGLVHIALASRKGVRSWQERFYGDRNQIRLKASKKALEKLWRHLGS